MIDEQTYSVDRPANKPSDGINDFGRRSFVAGQGYEERSRSPRSLRPCPSLQTDTKQEKRPISRSQLHVNELSELAAVAAVTTAPAAADLDL